MQVINESAHMRQHRYFLALQLLKYYDCATDKNPITAVNGNDISTYPIINPSDDGQLQYVVTLTKLAIEDLWFYSNQTIKEEMRQHDDAKVRWFTFINEAKVALQAKIIKKSNFDVPYITVKVGLTEEFLLVEVCRKGSITRFKVPVVKINDKSTAGVNNQ